MKVCTHIPRDKYFCPLNNSWEGGMSENSLLLSPRLPRGPKMTSSTHQMRLPGLKPCPQGNIFPNWIPWKPVFYIMWTEVSREKFWFYWFFPTCNITYKIIYVNKTLCLEFSKWKELISSLLLKNFPGSFYSWEHSITPDSTEQHLKVPSIYFKPRSVS